MSKIPKVSIICPVYNAEKYLARCLDSILAQTLQDWELLVVIDGSPDGSAAIAEMYAAPDARIRVIHQENQGVSAARQAGLEAAVGDYVIHADPDDWVEPGMLQELYSKALAEQADVVLCDYFVDAADGRVSARCQEPSELKPAVVLRELFSRLHGSCGNKLVRRSCFAEYGIRFPEGVNYCEDLLVCVQLFRHEAVKVAYVPKAFYHYVQHGTSITHRYTFETYRTRLRYQEFLEQYLPAAAFGREIRKSRLVVFTEAYMRGVLSNDEAWKQLWRNRRAAFLNAPSRRWLAGYAAMLVGCFSVAKRFLTI